MVHLFHDLSLSYCISDLVVLDQWRLFHWLHCVGGSIRLLFNSEHFPEWTFSNHLDDFKVWEMNSLFFIWLWGYKFFFSSFRRLWSLLILNLYKFSLIFDTLSSQGWFLLSFVSFTICCISRDCFVELFFFLLKYHCGFFFLYFLLILLFLFNYRLPEVRYFLLNLDLFLCFLHLNFILHLFFA